jgi:hypothetical protein
MKPTRRILVVDERRASTLPTLLPRDHNVHLDLWHEYIRVIISDLCVSPLIQNAASTGHHVTPPHRARGADSQHMRAAFEVPKDAVM